jgi:dipeptidase E
MEVVRAQDVIYAGGGSMRNLLAIWRAHALERLLIEAWEQGTVLAGISAGAMCWFEGGVTKSSGPPEPIAGLGLLPGVAVGPRRRRAGAAAGLARRGRAR